MEIHLIPAFSDNYVYLLRDPESDAVGVVDPGDAAPVVEALERRGWRLTHILNTHHHNDHIGGNAALKARYAATVIGAAADAHRIPELDVTLGDGDTAAFGGQTARVIDTPGHTVGHIAFWFEGAEALFCGDTLFALGCGRLFEGTAAQMWGSLRALRALPEATRVYCGHEYTLSNARFAVTVDPENDELQRRFAAIKAMRERGEPTIPSTIAEERRTNPFLRADDAQVQAAIDMAGADPGRVFAELRRRKDGFR
ncbi:hydroxyacylglutathione hydrolase [Azospirillum sp. RWY-5-1]|uniref:Hydroxyacylglutathione hydrolase n=1 Tax=Azospirillum oleiclasticum TaxID=2735135 RepID=A0ABX2T2X6_9PROT|nr:hydroxyacylglutathione hydrolase [Azospirillum oleiclasticum]NYZ11499.1 hydroxyacylglutathione hydrolase [Azospirillum oleiclasticum]NYZ18660.1 hydroxyacylglutathione hydrolase [Azospirillum oleiclasticum]